MYSVQCTMVAPHAAGPHPPEGQGLHTQVHYSVVHHQGAGAGLLLEHPLGLPGVKNNVKASRTKKLKCWIFFSKQGGGINPQFHLKML